MNNTVVYDGEMGIITKVTEGDLPYYTGATEVTPSDQTQTLPTADTIVTSNITINPIPDIDLEDVQVTYTPDEEGQTDTITPSTGYAGIAEVEVTIEPIDTDYVGSGIARNDSDDLTASGATVTAPAGYYENDATKTIASGSAATPATSITANPSISVGNDGAITATVSATQSVTPTVESGYVSSGTAGTITVSGTGSSQLSTQAAATITPTTSQQTAVAAGKFTTGAVIVDAMPSGTAGTPTATKGEVSNHSVSVTPSVTNTTGYITGGTKTGTAVTVSASELVSGTKSITANGTNIDVTGYAAVDVAVPGDTPTLQTKSVSYTPTESAQSASVTADQGYDGLDEVNVSVGAISSSYVGSAIDRRDSTDLSASGATVTAPAGYYESAATKSVASGTAGTPSATKGAVSNHSVSVTPSVTNVGGYISGGTLTGTAVTVDVTELESGTKSITENGTGISVSGYSAVDVNVSGGGGGVDWDEVVTKTYQFGNLVLDSATTWTGYPIFKGVSGLTGFTATALVTAGSNGSSDIFEGCSNLVYAFLPEATTLGRDFVRSCGKFEYFAAPKATTIGAESFRQSGKLKVADLGLVTDIGARMFYSTDYASAPDIILRSPTVASVAANAIQYIGAGIHVYVPSSLISTYEQTTNWSTGVSGGTVTFYALENSTYESTTWWQSI